MPIKKQRFSMEQIVAVLKQVGMELPVKNLIRQVGMAEQYFTAGSGNMGVGSMSG